MDKNKKLHNKMIEDVVLAQINCELLLDQKLTVKLNSIHFYK